MKATILLNKLLSGWFWRNICLVRVNFSFYYTVCVAKWQFFATQILREIIFHSVIKWKIYSHQKIFCQINYLVISLVKNFAKKCESKFPFLPHCECTRVFYSILLRRSFQKLHNDMQRVHQYFFKVISTNIQYQEKCTDQGMSIQYYWYFQYFQHGIGYWYFQYFWNFCQIKVLVLNTFISLWPILFILIFCVFWGSLKEN